MSNTSEPNFKPNEEHVNLTIDAAGHPHDKETGLFTTNEHANRSIGQEERIDRQEAKNASEKK